MSDAAPKRSVLIDTSTLITVALASDERTIEITDTVAMRRKYGSGLDGAISAMILYDDPLVDRASLDRNTPQLPSLDRLRKTWRAGEVEADEDSVYALVGEKYVAHLDAAKHLEGLAVLEADAALVAEVNSQFGPAGSWREIERELHGEARKLAIELREMFGASAPASAAACGTLLRTFYYDCVQQVIGADLVVHPAKAVLREESRGAATRILDAFENSVRAVFMERRRMYLGEYSDYQVPMLTQYVLSHAKSWADIPEAVLKVRNSSKAATFREGVCELLEGATEQDRSRQQRALEKLDTARLAWQEELGPTTVTTPVTLSVPILGVEKEWKFPDIVVNRRAADKVLPFVHLLLKST